MPTIPLQVLPIRQREITFYLATVHAKQLAELCSGLRISPFREESEDGIGVQTLEDAKKLVSALEDSTFAKEVSVSEGVAYEIDDPYQRGIYSLS
jgi:hypothetical protein